MGQAAAHDRRDFREDLAHVERAGHGVQEAAEALDALATQELALLQRRVLDGEGQQVGHGVHQGLILAPERVGRVRGEPGGPEHDRALPDGAQQL